MNDLDCILRVLNPAEREYFLRLLAEAPKAKDVEEFAATVKALLAVIKDGPYTHITLGLGNTTPEDVAELRARLTPEENARLSLDIVGSHANNSN